MRGLYALLLSLDKEIVMKVGSLGRVDLKSGMYVYVGSGLGVASMSIEGRLNRYFSRPSRRHWHIDYLLRSSRCRPVLAILSEARGHLECSLATKILEDPRASVAHKRFGASDCSCSGHLIFFGSLERSAVERLVHEKFEDLKLKPQRWLR